MRLPRRLSGSRGAGRSGDSAKREPLGRVLFTMASPTAIAAYLALFASVGFIFLFVNLLVG